MQMSPIALYNFISFDQLKGSGSKESVVLLDIGADNTDLIITDGTRIWQRNVPIGGNHFTRALTKELKLTFAKAEHLKRNATKAPDPRAIFTAMRGVFNDFASEINRSIGFYSSINRTAKIRKKIVGMGNGFKLPGLQKFLQQNLNNEVGKLEGFDKLVGDEVKSAPQFQDNLASFAVAYGLGVQGLGRGALGHEPAAAGDRAGPADPRQEAVGPGGIGADHARADASCSPLGDYRVLAKVTTPQFKEAVSQAKSVSKQGAEHEGGFREGQGGVGREVRGRQGADRRPDRPGHVAAVPEDDQRATSRIPVKDYGLDPDAPGNPGHDREAAGPHRRDQAGLADRSQDRVV